MFSPEVPQSGGSRSERKLGEYAADSSTSILRSNYANATSLAAVMTEEELENVMENFAKEDAYFKKTWSRIVVEKFLSKVRFLQ